MRRRQIKFRAKMRKHPFSNEEFLKHLEQANTDTQKEMALIIRRVLAMWCYTPVKCISPCMAIRDLEEVIGARDCIGVFCNGGLGFHPFEMLLDIQIMSDQRVDEADMTQEFREAVYSFRELSNNGALLKEWINKIVSQV